MLVTVKNSNQSNKTENEVNQLVKNRTIQVLNANGINSELSRTNIEQFSQHELVLSAIFLVINISNWNISRANLQINNKLLRIMVYHLSIIVCSVLIYLEIQLRSNNDPMILKNRSATVLHISAESRLNVVSVTLNAKDTLVVNKVTSILDIELDCKLF